MDVLLTPQSKPIQVEMNFQCVYLRAQPNSNSSFLVQTLTIIAVGPALKLRL